MKSSNMGMLMKYLNFKKCDTILYAYKFSKMLVKDKSGVNTHCWLRCGEIRKQFSGGDAMRNSVF